MAIKIDGEDYYSLREAAKLVGVSETTMLRWVKKVKGLKFKAREGRQRKNYGRYYIAKTSVEWLKQQFGGG